MIITVPWISIRWFVGDNRSYEYFSTYSFAASKQWVVNYSMFISFPLEIRSLFSNGEWACYFFRFRHNHKSTYLMGSSNTTSNNSKIVVSNMLTFFETTTLKKVHLMSPSIANQFCRPLKDLYSTIVYYSLAILYENIKTFFK